MSSAEQQLHKAVVEAEVLAVAAVVVQNRYGILGEDEEDDDDEEGYSTPQAAPNKNTKNKTKKAKQMRRTRQKMNVQSQVLEDRFFIGTPGGTSSSEEDEFPVPRNRASSLVPTWPMDSCLEVSVLKKSGIFVESEGLEQLEKMSEEYEGNNEKKEEPQERTGTNNIDESEDKGLEKLEKMSEENEGNDEKKEEPQERTGANNIDESEDKEGSDDDMDFEEWADEMLKLKVQCNIGTMLGAWQILARKTKAEGKKK